MKCRSQNLLCPWILKVLLYYIGTYESSVYTTDHINFNLADHTVLYAVAGVLIVITLTIFVVTLGVYSSLYGLPGCGKFEIYVCAHVY
jgi:cytochrome c oxidase assembly factor CtaG